MRARYLFVSLVLGLGMVLGLLWLLGDQPVAAELESGAASPAAVLEVCGTCTYTTIQDAVDAANPGDTIKVAQGTYTGVQQREGIDQLVYISKTVTIRGGYVAPVFAEPPNPVINLTTLDAQGLGRVLVITGSITPTIEGLRITDGDATGLGGGAWAYNGAGGGIYVDTAMATIRNCQIYNNLAGSGGWSGGGGVYLLNSASTLENNVIFDNRASTAIAAGLGGEGGGVAISGGDAILTGNVIYGNIASTIDEGIGGGIYLELSDTLLRDNIIYGNTASGLTYGQGGGIYVGFFSSPAMTNTVLINNFAGTTTDSWGAGIAVEWAAPRLWHSTISNNSGGVGTGVYAYNNGSVAMTNTIVANHTTAGVTVTSNSSAELNAVLWSANGVNAGPGAITVTNAYTGVPNFTVDGYHLSPNSPAIDQGVDAGVTEDIDGQLRNTPDLGADEWRLQITVDPSTGGTIVYTDTQGLTTTIVVPVGAVTRTVAIYFTPLATHTYPFSPGLVYANHAFDLDALCGPPVYLLYLPLGMRSSASQAGATAVGPVRASPGLPAWPGAAYAAGSQSFDPCTPGFQVPVTITIYYSDTDVISATDESSLRLYYWTGIDWQDAASTCAISYTQVYTPINKIELTICHLSRYGLGAR